MYCYFHTDFPSAIKVNGNFLTRLDKSASPFLIDTKKVCNFSADIFIEIICLNGSEHPLYFILNDEFFCSPPLNVQVVDLAGGYFIKVLKTCTLSPFKVISQQKFPFAVATVFKENGLKLSIETANDFYAETLFFDCEQVEIAHFMLENKKLLALNFKGEQNKLFCYLVEGKITKVFCKEVSSFSFNNGFCTTEQKQDIANHQIVCEWGLNNAELVKKDISITKKPDFSLSKLNSKILGYAFLEEFLCGGEILEYLSENIKENAHLLKDYFLDFIGVFPPPFFRPFNQIGLLYKKTENKYYARYFEFEIENNKLCNIKRSE